MIFLRFFYFFDQGDIVNITYGKIWKVAYPILISLVTEHVILLTDTAFLGRVGEVELGASALAGVYFLAVFMLGFGFSMGAQILIGRRNGEGRFAKIGPIVTQGGIFLVALAILAFAFTNLCSPFLLKSMFKSEEIFRASILYLDWRVYGFFFAFVSLIFRAFFVGIQQTRVLSVSSLVMVTVNIMLNYTLIFGKFGFPEMGIGGAALASSIAEAVAMLFLFFYIRLRVDLNKYGFSLLRKVNLKLIGEIFSISVWTMIQYLLTVGIWFIFFVAIEHLGEREIAVSNIVRSFSAMAFMPLSALAAASVAITSNLMGAMKHDLVLSSCWKVIKMCYLIVSPLAVLALVAPELFIRIYTDNLELVKDTMLSLRVMASCFFIAIPACILFQTVSGTGNTRSALLMELGPFVAYSLFIYYVIIDFKMDVAICWLSEHVYWTCILLISYLYMKKANWRSKKI